MLKPTDRQLSKLGEVSNEFLVHSGLTFDVATNVIDNAQNNQVMFNLVDTWCEEVNTSEQKQIVEDITFYMCWKNNHVLTIEDFQ